MGGAGSGKVEKPFTFSPSDLGCACVQQMQVLGSQRPAHCGRDHRAAQ